MQKVYTLLLAFISALAVSAQDSFPLQFAYADGTIIPDGTTLQLNDVEEDDFGDVQVPTRLFVKNTTSEDVRGGATYNVTSITNGVFQTCFPLNCVQQSRPGEYTTENEFIAAGELKNMLTEWIPGADEGNATVTYQLLTFKQNVITKKWNKDKDGPKITLRFSYGTADGIGEVKGNVSKITSETYSDMQGRTVCMPRRGLYIKRTVLGDGTVVTRKITAK